MSNKVGCVYSLRCSARGSMVLRNNHSGYIPDLCPLKFILPELGFILRATSSSFISFSAALHEINSAISKGKFKTVF